jgi:glucokinase
MPEIYLGIDIGGTTCAVCAADEQGRMLSAASFATGKGELGWEKTVGLLVEEAGKQAGAAGNSAPRAIGISCGSPMDREKGVIEEPANLPGWKDVPIVSLFREAFPGTPVHLENDANAGALAECHFGAGKNARDLLFLTFGTGLGAGLILDRRLYRGSSNYAGEVGHLRLAPDGPLGCGKPGSFEGFCSGGGIAQLATDRRAAWSAETCLDGETVTARDVGLGARNGDELCLEILSISGRHLGQGLALLVDTLNPELIVIGSIFTRCEEFLRPAMEETLEQEARKETLACCRIVPAALDEEIGLYSALCVALYGEGLLGQAS